MVATTTGTLPHRAERERDAEERRLLRALRDGDEAAFVALVRRHHPMLGRMARLYVPDGEGERLAQDVWSAALGQLDALADGGSLRAALLTILHEQARQCRAPTATAIPFAAHWRSTAEPIGPAVDPVQFRTGESWPGHWAVPVAEWQPLGADLLGTGATAARIDEEFTRLAGAQREVGATLGISDGHQRLLLHAARSRLRAALDAMMLEAQGQEG